MIAIKKINNEIVKATKRVKPLDNRPIKGAKLFDNMTGNVFLSAKTNSGKTCTVAHIIEKCADRNTTIIAFCSTLYDDDSWAAIREYCEKHKIPFIGHQSMVNDDNKNEIDILLKELKEEALLKEEAEREAKLNGKKKRVDPIMLCDTDSEDDEEEEDKPRKSKYQTPRYIIIFDDLAEEIKSIALTKLLKKSRHYKMKVIVSSQYYLDCEKGARGQFYYYLIYGGTDEATLEKIKKDSGIPINMETFERLYRHATKQPYSFLYISRKGEYRKNFDSEYTIRQSQ